MGRSIVIDVNDGKNMDCGKRCWEQCSDYPMFLPGLIKMVLSQADWEEHYTAFFNDMLSLFNEQIETKNVSNGLRIASNWALNALGFQIFVDYLAELGLVELNEHYYLQEKI